MNRPPRVKDKLRDIAVVPHKSRGQNFVIAPTVIPQIVQFAPPQAGETIVEIGPGLGALTGYLVKYGAVTAIEIEPKFCASLAQTFPALTLINQDVRLVDFSQIGSSLVVYGNIPYSLSTDIIFHLLLHRRVVKRAILLVQKEFAERVAAEPGGRDYGAITVAVGLRASSRLGPVIDGNNFHPPTEVESQVIELTFRPEPLVQSEMEKAVEELTRRAFQKRRKMLSNSLGGLWGLPDEKLAEGFRAAEIDDKRRPETLSPVDFVRLTKELKRISS